MTATEAPEDLMREIAWLRAKVAELEGEPGPALTLPHVLAAVHDTDAWLDGAVADTYQGQPLAQDWARVAKVAEEAGEAVSALIACTGQNPRKGVCGTQDAMLGELADVFCTGIFAIQHFTKDAERTWAIVSAGLAKAHGRALAAAQKAGASR